MLINAQLSALMTLVPDGSTISGVLERLGIGYRCRLQAVSIHGPIRAEVLANDPRSALVRLEKRLNESLSHERI